MTILASSYLIKNQFAEHFAFATQHKLASIRLRRFKEAEAGIRGDSNPFQRHQSPHDVGKVRRESERIFVDDFGQFVSKLFKVYFAQSEVDVVFEESLNDRSDSFRIDSRLKEVQANDVLPQSFYVASHNVKKRINHL